MPTIKQIEHQIKEVERFWVTIKYKDGRDVRDDKDGMRNYPYTNAAGGDSTVAHWREVRFFNIYPREIYDVDILEATGGSAHPRKQLATVRATYENA